MSDANLTERLMALPINHAVAINDTDVYLQVTEKGAALKAVINTTVLPSVLAALIDLGFTNALLFEAGIAIDQTQNQLILVQWLDGVRNWTEAEDALELMLNQVDACRSMTQNPLRHNANRLFTGRNHAEEKFRAKLYR